MSIKTLIMAAAAASLLAGCDSGQQPAAPAAPAVPAATPAPAPTPAAPAAEAAPNAADLERARLAAMANVFPDQAAWTKACVEDKVDAKVCDCVGKATVKTLGVKGLYAWVWQGYVNREGTARMRSTRWFGEQNVSKPDQQKFADAVGKCYV